MHKSMPVSIVFRAVVLLVSVCLCGCGSEANDKPASKRSNPLAGCVMCHVDVEDEYVKSKHYNKLQGGCADCHGPSEGHLADENNDIKPDELYASKDVDRLCGRCHDCSRKTKTPMDKRKVCTDCHKSHKFSQS